MWPHLLNAWRVSAGGAKGGGNKIYFKPQPYGVQVQMPRGGEEQQNSHIQEPARRPVTVRPTNRVGTLMICANDSQ